MTMTDRPTIPAALMDLQPVSDAGLEVLAELAAAFPGSVTDLVDAARAATPDDQAAAVVRDETADDADAAALLAARAPEVHRFAVTDRGTAEWAMRKAAEVEAQRAERRELAKQWRDEVDRWLTAELKPLDATFAFFEGHLNAYMLAERAASDGKVKSIKLTAGTLKSTGGSDPKPAIADSSEVLAWAEELPEELLDDAERSPLKITREVQISRLTKMGLAIHEVETDRADEDGEPITELVVCPAVDPETGEPWGDDFDPAAHAIPGMTVELPQVKPRVEVAK